MGLYELASIVGIASGLVAAGFLWEALHLATLLVVIGAFALSLALFALVRDPHPTSPSARSASALLQCLRSWQVLRLAPAWVGANAIVGLWLSHLGFQLAKADDPTQLLVGGFSGRQTGLTMGGIVALFVIGIGLWTLALGRLETTRVMGIAIGGAMALVVALALLNSTRPEQTGRVLAFLGLAALLLMVVSGFTPAVLTYLARLAEETPTLRGSVMGLYTVLLGVGQALGAVLGGYFADWRGVDGMIVYSAILAVIAAAFVASLARGDARRATSPSP